MIRLLRAGSVNSTLYISIGDACAGQTFDRCARDVSSNFGDRLTRGCLFVRDTLFGGLRLLCETGCCLFLEFRSRLPMA